MCVMIRTRDFVLFIVALLFLGVAITLTVGIGKRSTPSLDPVVWDTSHENELLALSNDKTLNRQTIIDRLKDRLALNEERIEPSPSVEAPEGAEETVPVETDVRNEIQRCLYPDDSLALMPKWPLTGVHVEPKEGVRLVYITQDVVVSSSTVPATSSSSVGDVVTTLTPLLTLPLVPQKQAASACVPSEIVGVTNWGILIFNSEVKSYRGIPANVLIGYARDGFPIYGTYDGEVDACGGYDHPGGYRYTVSSSRPHIIGCYVGTPASFSL